MQFAYLSLLAVDENFMGEMSTGSGSWSSTPDEEVVRISHLYECEMCGEKAIDHVMDTSPWHMTTLGSHDGRPIPYLHRMCDGRLVKL